ncbi:unnamed protein product [Alopecurus aequalis]
MHGARSTRLNRLKNSSKSTFHHQETALGPEKIAFRSGTISRLIIWNRRAGPPLPLPSSSLCCYLSPQRWLHPSHTGDWCAESRATRSRARVSLEWTAYWNARRRGSLKAIVAALPANAYAAIVDAE